MKYRLSFILTLISLLPTIVLAQGLMGSWYEWLNIPAEWTTPPNLIYFVFIPFLGTFAIIWGILTGTRARIFTNQRVNIVISFVFAISLFYFNILPPIVLYLFAFGGIFGVVAFFILFFVLTFLFGRRKISDEYFKTIKSYDKVAKERSKKIDKIVDIDKRMSELRKEHKEHENELNKLELVFRAVKGMDPEDPRIKERGHSSKKAFLDYISDQVKKYEKALEQNIKNQDEIRKKKMRES